MNVKQEVNDAMDTLCGIAKGWSEEEYSEFLGELLVSLTEEQQRVLWLCNAEINTDNTDF